MFTSEQLSCLPLAEWTPHSTHLSKLTRMMILLLLAAEENPGSKSTIPKTLTPIEPQMLSQLGTTAEILSKASSLVPRIGTDAHLYDDPDDVSIAPLLDSRFNSEKIEALKRLLALIPQGADVSNFSPQVVKNVVSQSLEVKKLVYLYLLHYTEKLYYLPKKKSYGFSTKRY